MKTEGTELLVARVSDVTFGGFVRGTDQMQGEH